MLNGMLIQVRSNPRLRWGLWAIFGIFWLYSILVLRDVLQDKQDKYGGIVQSVSRLNAQLAQPEWISRVVPAKTMAVQMESRLWQAPTSGLAQAAFQDWLKATLAQVGLNQPMLTVTVLEGTTSTGTVAANPVISVPTDLWKVRATLSFEFNPEKFNTLMNKIEFGEKLVSIETLSIRKEPAPRVDMQLTAYFQKQLNLEQSNHTQTRTDISPTPLIDFSQKHAKPEQSSPVQAKLEQSSPAQPIAEQSISTPTKPEQLSTAQAKPEQSSPAQAKPNMPSDPFTAYLKKQAKP